MPPRNVYGPESITVPLIFDSPDAENPDSPMETSDSFAGAHLGSDAGTAGRGAGACVVVGAAAAGGVVYEGAADVVVGRVVVACVVVAVADAAAAAGLSSFLCQLEQRMPTLPAGVSPGSGCTGPRQTHPVPRPRGLGRRRMRKGLSNNSNGIRTSRPPLRAECAMATSSVIRRLPNNVLTWWPRKNGTVGTRTIDWCCGSLRGVLIRKPEPKPIRKICNGTLQYPHDRD